MLPKFGKYTIRRHGFNDSLISVSKISLWQLFKNQLLLKFAKHSNSWNDFILVFQNSRDDAVFRAYGSMKLAPSLRHP